jgi:hypothetical protein
MSEFRTLVDDKRPYTYAIQRSKEVYDFIGRPRHGRICLSILSRQMDQDIQSRR